MKHFIILSFLFLLTSCIQNKKVSNQNLSSIYRKDLQTIHPELVVYHSSDSVSQLHFKIDARQLLFTRPYNENYFRCNVNVSCFLKPAFEAKEILDSSSVRISDMGPDNSPNKNFVGSINFNATTPNTYLLEVVITDLNRNQTSRSYININKTDNLNAQNFFVTSKKTNLPFFRQHFETTDEISVLYRDKNVSTFFVRYYNRAFPTAEPPFSITPSRPFEYRADSMFTITTNDSNKIDFMLPKNGFYHLLADTSKKEGLTFFHHYDNFPELSNADHLLQPLCYLTTKQEFTDLMASKNKKMATEEFWTKLGGSQERAKELIRKYYGRVKDTNKYFTSYLEGWKTDRGMVYIVYGAPNIIYKTTNSESWVYGEENNFMSLTYTFIKVKNPFTDNDYTLDRSTIYKTSWYKAVDIWRQGRIYLEN